MGKHHTEDYKLSAVRYALKTDNQVETCEVFDCKRQSLQRWIQEYEATGSITNKKALMNCVSTRLWRAPAASVLLRHAGRFGRFQSSSSALLPDPEYAA